MIEQRGDDLQVVLHPVVDLAHQVVLLGQELAERGVARDDGLGHGVQGLGQVADFRRRAHSAWTGRTLKRPRA